VRGICIEVSDGIDIYIYIYIFVTGGVIFVVAPTLDCMCGICDVYCWNMCCVLSLCVVVYCCDI